jgi:hypothetical protein
MLVPHQAFPAGAGALRRLARLSSPIRSALMAQEQPDPLSPHGPHGVVRNCQPGDKSGLVRVLGDLSITAGEDYFRVAAGRLAGAGYAGLKDLL